MQRVGWVEFFVAGGVDANAGRSGRRAPGEAENMAVREGNRQEWRRVHSTKTVGEQGGQQGFCREALGAGINGTGRRAEHAAREGKRPDLGQCGGRQFDYVIILEVIMFAILGAAFISGGPNIARAGLGLAGILGLVLIILAIIIAIFLPIASIRFARTNNFSEAFNFGAILETIGKIGWISYILALIIGAIVIGIPVGIVYFILMMIALAIPFVGFLILIIGLLVIIPLVAVFHARYLTQIFDSAGAA